MDMWYTTVDATVRAAEEMPQDQRQPQLLPSWQQRTNRSATEEL